MPRNSNSGHRHHGPRVWPRFVLHVVDVAMFAFSTVIAFELRFDGAIPADYRHLMTKALCIWVVAKYLCFSLSGVIRGSWRHTSLYDAVRIVLANSAGCMLGGLAIFFLLSSRSIPRSVYILDWLVSCLLIPGTRLAVRIALTANKKRKVAGKRTRTLIYGGGAAGLALLRELRQNPILMCNVVGFIDDDPGKDGLVLDGKRVLGSGNFLRELVQKHEIQSVLIAIPSASGAQMVHVLKRVTEARVEYKMVPSLGELMQGTELGTQIREVAVEDLLGRKPVQLDLDRIDERIHGKVVMVTGAAGSIGSEICRQIASFHPLAIIGFDQAETPLFHIEREMTSRFPDIVFHPEIGSVTRLDTLSRVMEHYRPSIVYHAAAYKHVPLMERHIFAAVETNIFGTWNVACAASAHGVEDFVLISTDKAVRPTNMMGATKRVTELLIRALQTENRTRYVAVRFGNVLGSNGSVIPIFKEQIAAGGPVTVTHPEMTRYFMTIPEAAQLVLEAFSMVKGGEIFVLEMGEPVRIADLAENLIRLSGFQPETEIKIQYTGLRPGEKMYEELNTEDENLIPTAHKKIRSYVSNQGLDAEQANAFMSELQKVVEDHDAARLMFLLRNLVPEYNPSTQLQEKVRSANPTPVSLDELADRHERTLDTMTRN